MTTLGFVGLGLSVVGAGISVAADVIRDKKQSEEIQEAAHEAVKEYFNKEENDNK